MWFRWTKASEDELSISWSWKELILHCHTQCAWLDKLRTGSRRLLRCTNNSLEIPERWPPPPFPPLLQYLPLQRCYNWRLAFDSLNTVNTECRFSRLATKYRLMISALKPFSAPVHLQMYPVLLMWLTVRPRLWPGSRLRSWPSIDPPCWQSLSPWSSPHEPFP